MNEDLVIACKRLAQKAFFAGLTLDDVHSDGFALRTGKTWSDVKTAIARGITAGRGKFEHEISEAATRLARVLKHAEEAK